MLPHTHTKQWNFPNYSWPVFLSNGSMRAHTFTDIVVERVHIFILSGMSAYEKKCIEQV